jgi:hypothetical protein
MYRNSVGHNSTLIIGLTPDNRGLIPDADVNRLKEWGEAIKSAYANPVVVWKGAKNDYVLHTNQPIKEIVLQEKIEQGERVRSFVVESLIKNKWIKVDEGTCIGNKYMHVFDQPIYCKKIRLRILESVGDPEIESFIVY